MKLSARISAAMGALTGKSLAAFSAAFARGDDVVARSDKSFVRPYEQSAWIRAAINLITGEISGRPVKHYDGENEVVDRAFADFWAAPALGPKTLSGTQPRMPIGDVLRDLASWAANDDEFFVVLDDAWLLATARVSPASLTPFLIANPQRMDAIIQGGLLAGWRYTDAAGKQMIFLPEQVMHWKAWNPYDDFRGLGALKAARVAAEGAFLTSAYIRDLMRNNGDQGFIVVGKNGGADETQKQQIVADLRAKRSALARGVAKDLFLTGDITVDRAKEQAAGADLAASLAMSQQEVFVAYGVPPSMAAVKQAYSIGKDSDRYQLITGRCMPIGASITGVFASIGSRMVGRTLTAELDWDDHPVMVEVRTGRIDSLIKLFGIGVPVKTANDYLDLGLDEFPGWEISYLPFSVSPSTSASAQPDPVKDPALAEPKSKTPEDPEIATLKALILARSRSCVKVEPKNAAAPAADAEFAGYECRCLPEFGPVKWSDVSENKGSERDRDLWRMHMRSRRATVKSFQSAFGRVLMTARQETLRKIDGMLGTGLGKGVTKAAAVDFLFDLAKFTDSFKAVMQSQQKSALQTAGDQLLREVGKDDPFKYPSADVLNYLASRENKLKNVPNSIFENIKEAIEAGLNAGETSSELADRVRGAFNTIDDQRAKRIALSETTAAYGAGRDQAMKQAGVQFKAWLTSGNDNVRSAHLQAGADYPPERAIPIDEPFIVGGEELMYPGDDAGSAGNVINCHCVSMSVAAPKSSDT